MKSRPRKHFQQTHNLIKNIEKKKIAEWLLESGYYPEQYVLPPCFNVSKFKFNQRPYFTTSAQCRNYKPDYAETLHISYPKSKLTDRIFGIIEPKIYHDLVYHLMTDWDRIIEKIFNKNNLIYSYSFPIPLKKKNIGEVGKLRAGRMIYEFIEMAENDLVSEAHKYKYIAHTDIKNFYPTIYTHSISWAMETKPIARAQRNDCNLLGNKIDKLLQAANDGCTNGIAIGSAVSDLISEILLAEIDLNFSKQIKKEKIKFLGVRFKDDYRFLCNTKTDAERILKILQFNMKEYNLSLNEKKSEIKNLPEGLYRPWIIEYSNRSLRYKRSVSYKRFESTYLNVLEIDRKHPDTGIIDKFISETITNKGSLKLQIKANEVLKVISLLLLLKERRPKTFPFILSIIELLMIRFESKTKIKSQIVDILCNMLNENLKINNDNTYDLVWLAYFVKSYKLGKIIWPGKISNKLLGSIKRNKQTFFNTTNSIVLFNKIIKPKQIPVLVKHLAVFPRK